VLRLVRVEWSCSVKLFRKIEEEAVVACFQGTVLEFILKVWRKRRKAWTRTACVWTKIHSGDFRTSNCDSSDLLHISMDALILFSLFLRVTDLLASYDMFLVSEQRTASLSYMQFEWPEMGECHHRQVPSFLETRICLLTCVAVTIFLRKGIAKPFVLEDDCLHVWGPSSFSGNCFVLKSRYVIVLCWLHNDVG
jgi:hypothetical protein